jgi:carboxypeptidase T
MSGMSKTIPVLFILMLFALPPAATAAPAERETGPRATYHTYASMVSEMQTLQSNHPSLVKMESIGKTYENRDIWALKLSDDVTTNDTDEPDVLIMGGLHAREIMGIEVPMYALNYLINNYGINETCTKYVNTREVWFVPMCNPDGHVYVEGNNDWRKNRRPTTGGNIGVDLNRNWGYQWGTDAASSPYPDDETYIGPSPFSEAETQAVRDLALRQRFATSVSFHSYSQLVLYPWGYTASTCPDNAEFVTMANVMISYNGYQAGAASELYVAHGGSDDYLYGTMGTRAFTIELDQSFYPPEGQIDSTCNLNREPVMYLIGYPLASIIDAGVWAMTVPTNGTIVDPDKVLNVTAKVMNFGSSDADVPVEVQITSPEGYLFTNTTSVHLRAGQVSDVKMPWTPPIPGYENYTLKVRTNMTGDKYAYNNEMGASFRMMTKFGAALGVTNTTFNIFPGESANYTLQVRSLSNREDDILLVRTGTHLNWSSLPQSVHLPPAGKADLTMTVTVPMDATPGDSAMVSVRASSSTGQGASGLATTTTYVLNPAPSAEAGDDVIVNVTVDVGFDGTRSTTPAGTINRFSWDFGDGNSSEGSKVTHAYARRGKYLVNLTVSNDMGWHASDTLNVTVLQFFRLNLSADRTAVPVQPGETGTVNLTVINEGNGPDDIEMAFTTPGWDESLDTSSFELSRAGARRVVQFSFTAPSNALFNSTAQFRINATSSEYPYSKKEILVTATVGAVHNLTTILSESALSADPGGSAFLFAAFSNWGNIEERPELCATEVPEGWKVTFSPGTFAVAPGNFTKVKVTATVPANALAGTFTFKVNNVPVSVTVNARYGLEASIAQAVISVKQGERGVFCVNVTNRGNAPDSFTIALTGIPAGITVEEALPSAQVLPGANATLTVAVRLAKGLTPGRHNLDIVVLSTNSTNATKTLPVQIEAVKLPTGGGLIDSANFFTSPLFIVLVIIIIAAAVGGGAYAATRRKRPPAQPAPSAARIDGPGSPPPAAPAPESNSTPPSASLPSRDYSSMYGWDGASGQPATSAQGAAPEAASATPAGSAGDGVPMAAAVPMAAVASSEGIPTATAFQAAEVNAEAQPAVAATAAVGASGTTPQAEAASTEVLCMWCFKPFKSGEAPKKCGSCGSVMHEACAGAAGSCTKCGGAL